MSSGPLRMKLKPRSAFSSCREETPRSRSAPPICENSQLIENVARVSEIGLAEGRSAAGMAQHRPGLFDRFRVLIEGQDVGPRFENGFAMAAASAGRIDHERSRPWSEQLDRFLHEHRTVVNEILHGVGLLFENQRPGGKPDWPIKQQCIHGS